METSVTATPISQVFQRTRAAGQMAFMPFVTAGDPDLDTTCEVIDRLALAGVDLIEVGVPYSDPVADGPVIQASYTRALESGFTLARFFETFRAADRSAWPPLVAMVSYSIIFRYGAERFLDAARDAGFAGFIVPDLPGDEAQDLAALVRQRNLDLVELLSPLTPPDRVPRILANGSGFVYCIAVAGTTGERDALPTALTNQLSELKKQTDLPLAVGFGVSRPEHIEALRGRADGAIVGSAIVRRFEQIAVAPDRTLDEIQQFASDMVAACHAAR